MYIKYIFNVCVQINRNLTNNYVTVNDISDGSQYLDF